MSLTEPADEAELPDDVASLIGRRRHVREASFAAERSHGIASCASVQNGNPLFWDDATAEELTGGPILPPSTLSLWSRPHAWDPVVGAGSTPLPTHFELKELFDLPAALVSRSMLTVVDPVRPGDVMTTSEVLRSVSDQKDTAFGPGRFWVIDVIYLNQRGEEMGEETVTGFGYRPDGEPGPVAIPAPAPASPDPRSDGARSRDRRLHHDEVLAGDRLPDLVHEVTPSTVVLGAMAARDWQPVHHDPIVARERAGVSAIFLDTPTLHAWVERHLTDFTGPTGRVGRLDVSMGAPILAGDVMTISAEVISANVDITGCGWLSLVTTIAVDGIARTKVGATIAVPTDVDDNPWARRGADWLV